MSKRYPGGIINRSAPVVVGPVDGEGGSAPGVWTLEQAGYYTKLNTWPKPIIPKALYSWGSNNDGQLGQNTIDNLSSPVQVGALTNWSYVTADVTSSYAIKSDGTLWSWGANAGGGQLGLNDRVSRSSPTQVGALTNWSTVSGGYFAALAIKKDGTLWSWGANGDGGLGQNDIVYRSSPVQVGSLTNWSTVSGAYFWAIATKNDGTLWSWGANNVGQLGQNNITNRSSPVQVGALTNWLRVSTSYRTSIAVKNDGTIWSWGLNDNGQLGQNDRVNRSSPVQVGALTNWSKLTKGPEKCRFVAATKTDGTLWAWGLNNNGQLGQNNLTNRSSPIQVGALNTWLNVNTLKYSTLAVKTDGTLWSWGQNLGLLGTNDVIYRSSPVQVGALTTWLFTGTGQSSSLALNAPSLEKSNLWVIGRNNFGQLAQNNLIYRSSPVLVSSRVSWSTTSNSVQGFFAIRTDGTLWGCGRNDSGQLGQNDAVARSTITQIGSSTDWASCMMGYSHVLAVKTNGTLWGWGKNQYGQIGSSDRVYRSSPTQIGALTNWLSVAGGQYCSIAIKTDGTLWAMGQNDSGGTLGTGNIINRSSPVQVGALTNWAKIALAQYSVAAVKTDGTLWTWGANDNGQLGQNDRGSGLSTSRSSPVQVGALTNWALVAVTGSSMYAIKTDGTLWAWGYNTSGDLGLNDTVNRSSPVQIGALTTWSKLANAAAIKTDGTLWAWGYNGEGQLGQNNKVYRSSPVQIGSNTNWSNITSGVAFGTVIALTN